MHQFYDIDSRMQLPSKIGNGMSRDNLSSTSAITRYRLADHHDTLLILDILFTRTKSKLSWLTMG